MNKKEITEFRNSLVIASITFFVIFILSVSLYFKTIYIDEIIQFLLIFPLVALIFTHDYWEYTSLYLISFIVSILVLTFATITLILLELLEHKWIFLTAVTPLVFMSIYRVLYDFFIKIFKRKPFFLDREKYKTEDSLYNAFLICSSLSISFLIYNSLKAFLFY